MRRPPLGALLAAASLTTAPFSAFLYGTREYVGVGDIWLYPVVAVCAVVATGVGVSAIFGRSAGTRTGLGLGWVVFALFWYRDVGAVMDRQLAFTAIPGELAWVLVLIAGIIAIHLFAGVSTFLRAGLLFSLTMAGLPLIQYGFVSLTAETGSTERFDAVSAEAWQSRPDIYYLILDGLGRADVLEEIYEIDLTEFIDGLGHEGFVVADRALSAHPMTWLSVPAVLDQEYQAYPGSRGRPATHFRTNRIMSGDSRTHDELAGQGYRFVTATEGSGPFCDLELSPIRDLAKCLVQGNSMNAAIRVQLAWMTPFYGLANRGLLPAGVIGWLEAEDLRWTDEKRQGGTFLVGDVLGAVRSVRREHGQVPIFVLAHMMYPHPPYSLDSECRPSSHAGFRASVDAWDDLVGLRMGVDCTRKQILQLIDSISQDAIIVLQSDHGPGRGELLKSDSVVEIPIEDLWTRSSVFSAVRLPEKCRDQVSDSYAGVNTFIVVFNCLAGTQRRLEPQYSYWAWYADRNVVDVTSRLRQYEVARLRS